MELRPSTDDDCPGRLTCFGGTRSGDESPLECLARELSEELGFAPDLDPALTPTIVLHTPAGEAWFYTLAVPAAPRACEPGHEAVWVEGDPGRDPRIADWHRSAFEALEAGRGVAHVQRPGASDR